MSASKGSLSLSFRSEKFQNFSTSFRSVITVLRGVSFGVKAKFLAALRASKRKVFGSFPGEAKTKLLAGFLWSEGGVFGRFPAE